MRESQLTPPTAKEACQESSCTEEEHLSSVTGGGKYEVPLSSTSLTKNEPPIKSSAACAIPSPCRGGSSPFWPDSPIVFSSVSDKSPFVYDTPLEKDDRTGSKRKLSTNHGRNWHFNLSQSRDELSGKMTRQLTRRDEEADSAPRMLMGSPCHALEEKIPRGKRLHPGNWNTTSSFLSDKQALRSLRKAAAFQKGPRLHNSTESHDDLQTISVKISEPSNTDSSNPTNMGADGSLDKEAMCTRLPQVQDDLQCIDMEISESPACPIILSHAYSCAPSVQLRDSLSSHSNNPIHLASGITPFSGSPISGSSVDKHAREHMESSLPSSAAKISELPLSESNDPRNSWKEDISNSLEHDDFGDKMSLAPKAGAFAVNITAPNVDMYPRDSGDIVEPIDMDISDDVEPAPTEMAQVIDDCNANSSEEMFSSKDVGTNSYLSKNNVSGTSEDRVAEVSENAASDITTDHFNTKLPSKKRSYSRLTSSTDLDIDVTVLNHLEQKPEHITLLTTSEDATQMSYASLPSNKNPLTCSLTNPETVEFSLLPKKSTNVFARKLKTLQNAFTVGTNCDQPSVCSSDDVRSTERSSVKPLTRKSTNDESNGCIGRIHSDDSATVDERGDCTPLAVSCTAFQRDQTDFPEHAGSHLGGVIEMSLFQDWGVTEDSLTSADHDGSTEVYDLGSQADQALEPIETWPVIDDGNFPDPEIVACSPLNSIETFTFRFPGESGFDEDEDEVNPRETRTTEGEPILVEERFLGFFMGPEVVICSDGNSETIVTSSEEFDSGASSPQKDNDEANLKTKRFQCEDSQTDELPLVVSVCASSAEELSEKLGFEDEEFEISEGSGPIAKQCTWTERCTEGCSEKLSQCLASHSSSKDESLIQSEEMVVSRIVEPVKGSVALPEVPETEFPCAEGLNTTPRNSMNIRDHSSEIRRVETSPGNEAEQRLRVVNCPGKWKCSKAVNTSSRLAENTTGRDEKVNLLCSSESPTVVQGNMHRDNSIERGQELNIPNDLRDTRVDLKEEKKISGCEELITLPKTGMSDNVEVKRSSDKKQCTASLNEGVTSTTLGYPSPAQSSNKLQSSGVNKPTDYTSTKHLPLKSVESSAKIVTDGKPVEETIRKVQLPGVTVSQPRWCNKPGTGSQEGKIKRSDCDSSDRDCQGQSEPLRDINDLQRDNRALNGKRTLVTEPGDMAKQLKLSPEPPSRRENRREVNFGDNRLYRHHTETGRSEHRQAEYGRQSSGPYWMAPSLPAHLPMRNGERGGLPRVVPSDPPWYPPIGVTNQNWFEGVYPSSADFGRAIFAPVLYRANPMFSPPGTVPGTWQRPGNSCHVTYPLLGRR